MTYKEKYDALKMEFDEAYNEYYNITGGTEKSIQDVISHENFFYVAERWQNAAIARFAFENSCRGKSIMEDDIYPA